MPLGAPRLRIPNLVLPLLREQLEYSQQELADRLSEEAVRRGDHQTICDVRIVRRWENGDVIWPQERYRILLEKVFGKPATQLGFVRKWKRSSSGWVLASAITGENEVRVDLVNPVQKSYVDLPFGGCDVDLLGDEAEMDLIAEVRRSISDERPRRIGVGHVERAEFLITRINSLDHDQGGGELLHQAINGARVTRFLLKRAQYSDKVGKRLEIVAGEMLIQAGWLAYDSGLHRLARRLYAEAFLLGQVSRHDEITAHSLSNMSIQANALGDPQDAVKFARAALQHVGSWATPRVRAVFVMHEARGLASLNELSACEMSLRASRRHFDAGPHDEDPNWIGYLNEEEFATLTGVCLMDLGRTAEASIFLETGSGSLENFARNRSSSATFYMRDLLFRREIEHACSIGRVCMPKILSLSSVRIMNQFQKFCEELGSFNSPLVDDFLNCIQSDKRS